MLERFFACHLICLIIGAPVAAFAEPIDLARRLVEVSQGGTMMQQLFDALTPQIMSMAASKDPNLSDEKRTRIEGVMRQELDAAIPEFLEQTAKIYAGNFTEGELQDVIDFYESPTGKKFQKLAPQLMQESMTHGQAMGQTVGKRALERLKADGDL